MVVLSNGTTTDTPHTELKYVGPILPPAPPTAPPIPPRPDNIMSSTAPQSPNRMSDSHSSAYHSDTESEDSVRTASTHRHPEEDQRRLRQFQEANQKRRQTLQNIQEQSRPNFGPRPLPQVPASSVPATAPPPVHFSLSETSVNNARLPSNSSAEPLINPRGQGTQNQRRRNESGTDLRNNSSSSSDQSSIVIEEVQLPMPSDRRRRKTRVSSWHHPSNIYGTVNRQCKQNSCLVASLALVALVVSLVFGTLTFLRYMQEEERTDELKVCLQCEAWPDGLGVPKMLFEANSRKCCAVDMAQASRVMERLLNTAAAIGKAPTAPHAQTRVGETSFAHISFGEQDKMKNLELGENGYLLSLTPNPKNMQNGPNYKNVTFTRISIVLKKPGLYFVYSSVNFVKCTKQEVKTTSHYVRVKPLNSHPRTLLRSYSTCCKGCQYEYQTKYVGGVFCLEESSAVYADVDQEEALSGDSTPGTNYLGLYLINDNPGQCNSTRTT